MPEFNEFDLREGQSQGRLAEANAFAGDYVYSLTDENQGYIDIDVPGPPNPYVEIFQLVDVTAIQGLTIRVSWKASPDTDCELQFSVNGVGSYIETIPAGSSEKDWFIVTFPCPKVVGVVPVAITLAFVS